MQNLSNISIFLLYGINYLQHFNKFKHWDRFFQLKFYGNIGREFDFIVHGCFFTAGSLIFKILTRHLNLLSVACRMPSSGRVVGNLEDMIKNMFKGIGGEFGF